MKYDPRVYDSNDFQIRFHQLLLILLLNLQKPCGVLGHNQNMLGGGAVSGASSFYKVQLLTLQSISLEFRVVLLLD